MYATQKLPTYKAANDPYRRPVAARRVSIVILPHEPRPVWQFMVGGTLLVSLGIMATAVWMLQQHIAHEFILPELMPAQVAQPILPSPPPKHAAAVAELAPLTDIIIPDPMPASKVITLEDQASAKTDERITPPAQKDVHELLLRAYDYMGTHDYVQAIRLFDEVLANIADNHDALAGRAFALAQNGESEQAIQASRHFLKFYPRDIVAEANLAKMLMKANRNEEAIAYLEHVVRDAPQSLSYRLDLATVYDRCGHNAAALTAYKQVLEKGSHSAKLSLLLPGIRQRVAYFEGLDAAADKAVPSTTSPEAK
jgi:tetratricopeptide (TPR) repeat protein